MPLNPRFLGFVDLVEWSNDTDAWRTLGCVLRDFSLDIFDSPVGHVSAKAGTRLNGPVEIDKVKVVLGVFVGVDDIPEGVASPSALNGIGEILAEASRSSRVRCDDDL